MGVGVGVSVLEKYGFIFGLEPQFRYLSLIRNRSQDNDAAYYLGTLYVDLTCAHSTPDKDNFLLRFQNIVIK